MAKSSVNIILQRLSVVVELLMKGTNRNHIVQYCAENWNIGERQSDKYIQRAKDLVEISVKRNIGYDYAKAVTRYESLFLISLESKEYKTALAVNKELALLQGLYKLQLEHSGNVQFICNLPE